MRSQFTLIPITPLPILVVVGCVCLAMGAGGLVAIAPLAGLVFVALMIIAGLLASGRHATTLFLITLGIVLTGYAFLGRGFAYIGFGSLYIGESLLALGAVALLTTARRMARATLVHVVLIVFMLLGAVRTIPYIEVDGALALRDAALWAYGGIAIAISTGMQSKHFTILTSWFGRFAPYLILWIPVAAILHYVYREQIPQIPGTGHPALYFKPGDMGVHLGGIAAFFLLGVRASASKSRLFPELALWSGWFVALAVVGALNRGGLLAAGAAVAGAFTLRAGRVSHRHGVRFIAVIAIALIGFAITNPTVDVGYERKVSFTQIVANLTSVVTGGSDEFGSLAQNTNWRLSWWNEIIDYTVHGEYFWSGKGFGANLATEDGFQVDEEESLRSPHSVHFSVLARMGVPGLLVWLLFLVLFAASMLHARRQAYQGGMTVWFRLLTWLLLYWLAALVNASFDVYIEGPQGGIWFWALTGLGLGAIASSQRVSQDLRMKHQNAARLKDEAWSLSSARFHA